MCIFAICILLVLHTTGTTVAFAADRGMFEQPLDHFTQTLSPTFNQYYYVESQHFVTGGPILLYSVGERGISESDVTNGWINSLAIEVGGMLVLLEQRFYGDSVPKLVGNEQGDRIWEYMTIEQMLADTRRFIEHIFPALAGNNQDSTYVLVGGSFAGSLAAWTKARYRDLDMMVVSSSAPLHIVDGYWEFDKILWQRLPCSSIYSQAIRNIDQLLDAGNDFALAAALSAQISELAQKPATPQTNQQFGHICNRLLESNTSGSAASSLLLMAKEYMANNKGNSECPKDPDEQTWLWQQCLETGWWQTAPPPSDSRWYQHRLRSYLLTVDYFRKKCQECMPQSESRWAANQRKQFRQFAEQALGWLISGSKHDVVFTVGQVDPWLYLTVGRPGAAAGLMDVVKIDGASHAEDLSSDLEDGRKSLRGMSVESARAHIVERIKQRQKTRNQTRMLASSGSNGAAFRDSVLLLMLMPMAVCRI